MGTPRQEGGASRGERESLATPRHGQSKKFDRRGAKVHQGKYAAQVSSSGGIGRQVARAMFAQIDVDHDGFLTRGEIREMAEQQGLGYYGDILRAMDADGDGQVSFDEFERWWTAGLGDGDAVSAAGMLSRLRAAGGQGRKQSRPKSASAVTRHGRTRVDAKTRPRSAGQAAAAAAADRGSKGHRTESSVRPAKKTSSRSAGGSSRHARARPKSASSGSRRGGDHSASSMGGGGGGGDAQQHGSGQRRGSVSAGRSQAKEAVGSSSRSHSRSSSRSISSSSHRRALRPASAPPGGRGDSQSSGGGRATASTRGGGGGGRGGGGGGRHHTRKRPASAASASRQRSAAAVSAKGGDRQRGGGTSSARHRVGSTGEQRSRVSQTAAWNNSTKLPPLAGETLPRGVSGKQSSSSSSSSRRVRSKPSASTAASARAAKLDERRQGVVSTPLEGRTQRNARRVKECTEHAEQMSKAGAQAAVAHNLAFQEELGIVRHKRRQSRRK
jgi:hypothetical protein